MNEEHYLSKINRNSLVMDSVPKEKREKYLQNLSWAIELSTQLEMLDYCDVREETIAKINAVLDDDYVAAGFVLKESMGGKKK